MKGENKMKHIKKIFIITVCVAMSLMILVSCSNAPSADGIALAAEKGPVTSDEAKSIALDHAGLKAEDVTFVAVHKDTENGAEVYDVEFISGDKEYDYDIEIATGKILNYDFEIDYTIPSSETLADAEKDYIGVDKAKEIVVTSEDLKMEETVFLKAKLENDNGKAVYAIEIKAPDPYGPTAVIGYEIDALTGDILERDAEESEFGEQLPEPAPEEAEVGIWNAEDGLVEGTKATAENTKGYLDIDKAIESAVSDAGYKVSDAKNVEVEIYKFADGAAVYLVEFEIVKDGKTLEYETEMDALTGKVYGTALENDGTFGVALDEDTGQEVEVAVEEDEGDHDD